MVTGILDSLLTPLNFIFSVFGFVLDILMVIPPQMMILVLFIVAIFVIRLLVGLL